jgi:hypothetical protein
MIFSNLASPAEAIFLKTENRAGFAKAGNRSQFSGSCFSGRFVAGWPGRR